MRILFLNGQSIPLKIARRHTICFLLLLVFKFSLGQGRVVINEFMPWPACSTSNEFIELLNFGPGPINIGCYMVTNGTYSVTIPANTILQRGQYFVLAGQDILSQNCGNADSSIHVDLNWTSCNCTNVPIPTTGDGFMVDGGSANEKLLLLDPNLNIIDAVSRDIPVSASTAITTSSLSGSCSSRTFDLDTMNITYESINNSTGKNNSFSRKVDGDCGWIKTPVISARAPNKTGSSASATYDFTAVSTSQCNNTDGSISIQVNAANVNLLFPMNYTLGFDSDGNGSFDMNDQYNYGTDNTAPSIDINHLAYGHYRITVATSSSCNLKSFDFFVFNCYTVILPLKLLYFSYLGEQGGKRVFKLLVDNSASVNTIVLEAKKDGDFKPVATLFGPFNKNEILINAATSSDHTYRLKVTNSAAVVSYSGEIKIYEPDYSVVSWPNPVKDKMFIKLNAMGRGTVSYTIVNADGVAVKSDDVEVMGGQQTLSIPLISLNKGTYYFKMSGSSLQHTLFLRFIK